MNSAIAVVGLVGLCGAGKSTASRVILSEFGFISIKLGDHIRDEMRRMSVSDSPENERMAQVQLGERARVRASGVSDQQLRIGK